MNFAAKILIALIAGAVLGWWLLAGTCNILWLWLGFPCGHNIALGVPLMIPFGIFICWAILGRLDRRLPGTSNKNESEDA
jgi:hypothetical protein